MSGDHRLTKRGWILVVVTIVVIGHALAMRYVLSHVAVSTTVVAGVVVLIVAKHLGAAAVLGPLYTRLRRRR